MLHRCSSVEDPREIFSFVESEQIRDARCAGCLAIRPAALAIPFPIYFQNTLSRPSRAVDERKGKGANPWFGLFLVSIPFTLAADAGVKSNQTWGWPL